MPEIHVYLAAGRSKQVKKKLMEDITDAVVRNTGLSIDGVCVQIIESARHDKMKGGKTFEERLKNVPPAED